MPGASYWADEALVIAFVEEKLRNPQRDGLYDSDWPRQDFREAALDGDYDLIKEIYETSMKLTEMPEGQREILWMSFEDNVVFWEGPKGTYQRVEEQFQAFAQDNAQEIMRQEVMKVIKRGMALGLSRGDLMGLVNEVLVSEVMEG